jgi:hypothetical protein
LDVLDNHFIGKIEVCIVINLQGSNRAALAIDNKKDHVEEMRGLDRFCSIVKL